MLADNQAETVETGETVEGAEVEKVETVKDESDPVAEKEKAKKRLSDRLREQTFHRRQAERERDELRQKYEALAAKAPTAKEPDPEDYSDRSKYTEDREAWKKAETARIEAEAVKKVHLKIKQDEQQQQFDKQKEGYIKGRAEAIKEDPKYHEYEKEIDKVVEAFEAPEIQDLILGAAKQGPRIVSYLGENPDELEEIASLSPSARIFRMGKLIAKLEAKPDKKISSAPAPTRSEKGGAPRVPAPTGRAFDAKKESFSAYARRVNSIK